MSGNDKNKLCIINIKNIFMRYKLQNEGRYLACISVVRRKWRQINIGVVILAKVQRINDDVAK